MATAKATAASATPATQDAANESATTSVDLKNAYAGSSNKTVAAKHNSWGQGVPRGTYSDAKDDKGRLEVFGIVKDGDGNILFNQDGTPRAEKRDDGSSAATGRYLTNHDNGGRYKVYNSMLTGLTPDQQASLTSVEAEAVVFDEQELEIKAVAKDGRTAFEFLLG